MKMNTIGISGVMNADRAAPRAEELPHLLSGGEAGADVVRGERAPNESKVFQLKSDLFFSIMYSAVAAVRPFSPLSLFSLTPSR